jgi:hypothetical protein
MIISCIECSPWKLLLIHKDPPVPPSPFTPKKPRPIRPRIADPVTPFSGSTGSDVHAHGENAVLPLFFKTGQKEGHLNLQYSGLSFAPCFPEVLEEGERAKKADMRIFPR